MRVSRCFFLRLFGAESPLYEEFGVKCFRIYLLLTFLNGVQACAGVFFQAIRKPVKAAITSMSKQLLFILPAMLILTRLIGAEGVLWSGRSRMHWPLSWRASFLPVN